MITVTRKTCWQAKAEKQVSTEIIIMLLSFGETDFKNRATSFCQGGMPSHQGVKARVVFL